MFARELEANFLLGVVLSSSFPLGLRTATFTDQQLGAPALLANALIS
jgi:hypothetical protein